jgi:hypothetical protein
MNTSGKVFAGVVGATAVLCTVIGALPDPAPATTTSAPSSTYTPPPPLPSDTAEYLTVEDLRDDVVTLLGYDCSGWYVTDPEPYAKQTGVCGTRGSVLHVMTSKHESDNYGLAWAAYAARERDNLPDQAPLLVGPGWVMDLTTTRDAEAAHEMFGGVLLKPYRGV